MKHFLNDTGGTKSRTLISLHEENGMMQHNLVKEHNQSNESVSPNILNNQHEELHNNVSQHIQQQLIPQSKE